MSKEDQSMTSFNLNPIWSRVLHDMKTTSSKHQQTAARQQSNNNAHRGRRHEEEGAENKTAKRKLTTKTTRQLITAIYCNDSEENNKTAATTRRRGYLLNRELVSWALSKRTSTFSVKPQAAFTQSRTLKPPHQAIKPHHQAIPSKPHQAIASNKPCQCHNDKRWKEWVGWISCCFLPLQHHSRIQEIFVHKHETGILHRTVRTDF